MGSMLMELTVLAWGGTGGWALGCSDGDLGWDRVSCNSCASTVQKGAASSQMGPWKRSSTGQRCQRSTEKAFNIEFNTFEYKMFAHVQYGIVNGLHNIPPLEKKSDVVKWQVISSKAGLFSVCSLQINQSSSLFCPYFPFSLSDPFNKLYAGRDVCDL